MIFPISMLIVDFPLTVLWILLVKEYLSFINENKKDYKTNKKQIRIKLITNGISIVIAFNFITATFFWSIIQLLS